MTARQFFLMLGESRRLYAFRMSQFCDVAAIPMCDGKYYARLKEMYASVLLGEDEKNSTIEPKKPSGPILNDNEARDFLFSVLSQKKRLMGI